jgi:transposase-like protein
MTYVHHAVVNETCPVCGQGRVLVASEADGHSLFAICEDCESEWNEPSESHDASVASRDRHTFLRYLEPDELIDHPWYSLVLNR